MTAVRAALGACHCCGQAQLLPVVPPHHRACCVRCGTRLRHGAGHRSRSRTLAFATAALILYGPAMMLPVMRIENLGYRNEAGILDGAAALMASGEVLIALIVFVCSVVIPLAKLMALMVLSLGGETLQHRHRALTYHLVELTGRWGMLDVLLVALLVAALKLGDIVSVTAGTGAAAFAGCVLLSLLATASFDPHQLWASDTTTNRLDFEGARSPSNGGSTTDSHS